MTLEIKQMCDRCGSSRSIADDTETDEGGWRELDFDHGDTPMTVCPSCKHAVHHFIKCGIHALIVIPRTRDWGLLGLPDVED